MSEYPTENQPKKPGRVRLFISLVILGLLVMLLVSLETGVIPVYVVISGSMEPTLQIGDRILIDRGAFANRYDVITFQDPENDDPHEKLVKRIVGMGGDVVEVKSGIVYVNGELQYSDKIKGNRINWRDVHVKVPPGYYFVLGDNRNDSHDSLNFGPLAQDNVQGVLKLILWPPGRWGRVDDFENN